MTATAATESGAAGLSDRELRTIIDLVYDKSGITLHEGKRELVAARLQKRLRQLQLTSYRDYLARLRGDPGGEELTLLLDAIATNHTHFFREPQHFTYLRDRVLPELAAKVEAGTLDLWCAAASTGEEPVTLAITLMEAGVERFRMLASDLSTKALAAARAGVYRMERVRDVPLPMLRKYFQKGLGAQAGLARVVPGVRQSIEYRAINLVTPVTLDRTFDFIFCRNVMIYFDKPVQQRVVTMLEHHLAPGGHLFIAHSESLNGITHGLTWVAPAVYRRPLR